MRQRVLQIVAVLLFLFLASSFGLLAYSFRDGRWAGQSWLCVAAVFLALAWVAARARVR